MKSSRIFSQIAPGLFLVGVPVGAAPTTITEAPVDTIAVIDVSGSMSWDLPPFKRALKNMLPGLLKAGDTFSLVYFSGPNQCALHLDGVRIRQGGEGLLDVTTVHRAIDTLDTIGLTCFTDPLELVAKLAGDLRSEGAERRTHVLFGSDGYDNTSRGSSQGERRKNILDAITKVAGKVDRVTTMGIGWSCDQGLLQDMASAAGGSFMFADDIARYTRDFAAAVSKRPDGARKKRVELGYAPLHDVVFTVDAEGDIAQHPIGDGAVRVPESAEMVWYVCEGYGGTAPYLCDANNDSREMTAGYAALALFAQRARRKTVRVIASGIRDARFIRLANDAFGPQRYNALADEAMLAVKSQEKRFVDGVAQALKSPDPLAYTVLDALFALARNKCRIVPDDPRFTYTPITRGRVDAASVITATDAKNVAAHSTALAGLCSSITVGCDLSKIDDLRAVLGEFAAMVDEVKAQKARKASYAYDPAPAGYPTDGLVFASEEANVSLRIVRPIHVDVSAAKHELPEALRQGMPDRVPSKRYQSFTVITGRILSTPVITAILDEQTWVEFARAGLVSGPYSSAVVAIELSKLPIVNDAMIETLSAEKTAKTAFELETAKAALKIANDITRKYLPREASEVSAWLHTIGFGPDEIPEAVAWLDKLGIRDGGYQPPSGAAPKKADPRVSWKLDVAIPGLSDLPSTAKVREKKAKIDAWKKAPKGKEPKFTLGERLVLPHVELFDAFVESHKIDLVSPTEEHRKLLAEYATTISTAFDRQRRDALHELGKAAIVAITGGEWFSDLPAGEKTVNIVTPVETLSCSLAILDVEIPL